MQTVFTLPISSPLLFFWPFIKQCITSLYICCIVEISSSSLQTLQGLEEDKASERQWDVQTPKNLTVPEATVRT